jgi:hypothetical protein
MLVWKEFDDLTPHRQAAHAGIEYADQTTRSATKFTKAHESFALFVAEKLFPITTNLR